MRIRTPEELQAKKEIKLNRRAKRKATKERKKEEKYREYNAICANNQDLIQRRQQSTPSGPEMEIMTILLLRKIRFQREHLLPNLYNHHTKKPLFVDFYLPDYHTVIEYDGKLHYEPLEGQKRLLEQQAKDNIKNTYCSKNGLRMLRIPYWQSRHLENIIRRSLKLPFNSVASGVAS